MAGGDPFRLGLALRLASRDPGPHKAPRLGILPDTKDLVTAALATWPGEFTAYLHAVDLSEEALSPKALDDFLEAAGFVRGIRPLIVSSLASLGILTDGARPRIARAEVKSALDHLEDRPGEIDRIFIAQMLALHATKRIHPSIALYRRLVELGGVGKSASLFLFDCIASDAAYGPSEKDDAGTPMGMLAHYLPILAAHGSPSSSPVPFGAFETAISEGEPTPLEQTVLALSRAADELARGESQAAAARIRPALMSLHTLGAKRAEARAHRILGLCSLASRQIQEGAEYLSNSVEMANLVPDPLEGFFGSLAAAGADFVLGDLRRAEQWRDKAATMAENAFRPDWTLGCDFLTGRIAFELGRYGPAEDAFLQVARQAERLGDGSATLRGLVWSGRAAAYGGAEARGREVLTAAPKDAEASWFLAELAAWKGDWAGASALAHECLASIPRRAWRPTDAFIWDSGFDMIEGPSLGRFPESPYLEDQAGAFATFARAMATGDPSLLVEITSRTREQRIALIHPQAHLYDYYGYIVCESFENGVVDPGTLLSRSWKALQMRTLRMADASMKNSFLEANRWNREIVAAARARRLV